MYDVSPQNNTLSLARKLRDQLQEMTAVSQALSTGLARDKKVADYLATLDHAICTQLQLVRQLELNSRMRNSDELRLERTLVDLTALCRDLIEKTDALSRPLLKIKAEFCSSLKALPALVDRAALEEMLLLLISTSVHAIRRNGAIRLELEQQGDQAVLIMTDTSGSLDQDLMLELFDSSAEPEERIRNLWLARQIAELHGGAMVARNTDTGGLRLAVSIPMTEPDADMIRSPSILVDSGGGWNPALVALADCLPMEAFLPDWGKK